MSIASARRILLAVALLAVPAGRAAADDKAITAYRVGSALTIDGRLIEEEWDQAEAVSDFVQSEPRENGEPTEKTEVRVLYDHDKLYVGVRCLDSEPDKIIVSDLKRDFVEQDGDVFVVIVDPEHDERNSFVFFVNAGSAQRDLQGANDGRDTNPNWDGVWSAHTTIDDRGWTAEMAIPYKTLGLSSGAHPVMGINFRRRIRRKNEIVNWSPLPRRFLGSRVSLAGELLGLGDVATGHNFRVKPYVLQNWTNRDLAARSDTDHSGEFGLDIKYTLTHGLALDVTYNTDFSQVEVDAEQINLTRFSLTFPEKRDFFLENAGLFQFGDIATERGPSRNDDTTLFYTRRIGLSATGNPLPILGGARLSGKVGAYSIGALNMQQQKQGLITANNFTVVRVSRDILANSDVGLIYAGREGSKTNDYNRAIGADVNMNFGQSGSLNTYYATTSTPGLHGDNTQFKISSKFEDAKWEAQIIYADIGHNFNPEVGFVPRRGVRNVQLNLGTRLRPKGNPLIREYYIHMNSKNYFNRVDHDRTDGDGHYSMQFFFRDGSDNHDSVNPFYIKLLSPARVSGLTIPAGEYSGYEYRIIQTTNRSKMLSANGSYYWGDFYDGTKTMVSLAGRLLIKPRFSTELSLQHNDVDIKAGAFKADLWGWRLNYSFNPFMSVASFIQYNSSTRRVLTNLRYNFRHRPLSDISVVYTEDRLTGGLADDKTRAFIVKYTHMLQF